jgi:hypothetical protein
MPEGKIAVAQASLRLENGTSEDKTKAIVSNIASPVLAFFPSMLKPFPKAHSTCDKAVLSEPEAKLFALSKDLSVKDFR